MSLITIAGNGQTGLTGDTGPATNARLNRPWGVAVDPSGIVYIADTSNNRIRKILANGNIATVAGGGTALGDGGPANSALLNLPTSVAVDSNGILYISDSGQGRIRRVAADGTISTIAGGGSSLADGTALQANIGPRDITLDASGNVYFIDLNRDLSTTPSLVFSKIRKLSTSGLITTLFDTDFIQGLATDSLGNVFFSYRNQVQELSPSGSITSIAGNSSNVGSYSGDGGPATTAFLNQPTGLALDRAGNLYIGDQANNAVRLLRPVAQSAVVGAVADAASERTGPISPGKIVVIYGAGLGPSKGATAVPVNGAFGTQLSGTTVSINGLAAPVYYASATQVNAIVPYSASGTTANVSVAYQGGISTAFSVPLVASSPSLFTSNSTGAGQAAAVNIVDGSLNSATNPVKIGGYISLYATGEGQTTPAGVDGKLATVPLPSPTLPVTATVGGVPAIVQYKGAVLGTVAGLMQVNVQIPSSVKPGGYVPVVLTVGSTSTVNGAVWIAVSN